LDTLASDKLAQRDREQREADMEDEPSRLVRPESYVLPPLAQTSKHSRTTSTVAQSFAADLDSMFGLGMGAGGIDTLSQTVEEK
jgi:hypothetical protein